jgi:uncharacterized protein
MNRADLHGTVRDRGRIPHFSALFPKARSKNIFFAHLLDFHSSRLNEDSTLKGQILETFVFTELQKQKSWSETPFELYHFRNGGHEVDFVLEHPDGSLIGIEVKGAKSLRSDDCKGIKYLKSLTQKQFYRGIVLYQGDQVQQMEERIFAMPIQSLWL